MDVLLIIPNAEDQESEESPACQ